MTNHLPDVVVGIDTHAETHHAAVVTMTGSKLADGEFPATAEGYQRLLAFVLCIGRIVTIGVEGTNSYGAGLARFLRGEDQHVLEVIRPARAVRRRGKSDPIDAYAAAAAVLADPNLPTPKTADGDSEAARMLLAARRSAQKARTAAQTQIKSLLVTAPERIRARFRGQTDLELLKQLRSLRPGPASGGVDSAALTTLRLLARRCNTLGEEIADIDAELAIITRRFAPALVHAKGVGPVVAAQLIVTFGDNTERLRSESAFAMICGVAPIPASSGKTTRFRLNRGGDRLANAAIHRIALVRLSSEPRSRDYITRRISEGKTPKEAMRALKRGIAREMFHHLTKPDPVPDHSDLRPLRLERGLSMEKYAARLDVPTNYISRLERGLSKNEELANRYRELLLNAA